MSDSYFTSSPGSFFYGKKRFARCEDTYVDKWNCVPPKEGERCSLTIGEFYEVVDQGTFYNPTNAFSTYLPMIFIKDDNDKVWGLEEKMFNMDEQYTPAYEIELIKQRELDEAEEKARKEQEESEEEDEAREKSEEDEEEYYEEEEEDEEEVEILPIKNTKMATVVKAPVPKSIMEINDERKEKSDKAISINVAFIKNFHEFSNRDKKYEFFTYEIDLILKEEIFFKLLNQGDMMFIATVEDKFMIFPNEKEIGIFKFGKGFIKMKELYEAVYFKSARYFLALSSPNDKDFTDEKLIDSLKILEIKRI